MPVPCAHTWRLEDPTVDDPREVVYRCPKCEARRVFPLAEHETPTNARNRIIAALMRGEALEKAGVA